MKNIKKTGGLILFSIVLCFCLFYSASLGNVYAKAKPKLSKKSITMYIDETQTIMLKNAPKKVTWTSSNKSIIKITETTGKKRNTVTFQSGFKAGKCTLKAKIGKKVYSCKVTVKYTKGADPKKYKTPKVVISKVTKSTDDRILRVEIQNGTKGPIGYETCYTLEKYVSGKWTTIPKKASYLYFPSWISYQYPYTCYAYNVSLSDDYELSQLTSGKYRLYIDISYFKKSQRYAEFKL